MATITRNLSSGLGKVLSNTYVNAGASLFLVMYASMARPQLPEVVVGLFDNVFFRLAVLTLVLYTSNHSLQLSVMVAVAFTVTMNMLNEQKIAEGFVDGLKVNMLNENFADNMDDADDLDDMDDSTNN